MRKTRVVALVVTLLAMALVSAPAASAEPGILAAANVTCASGDGLLDFSPALTVISTPTTVTGRGTAAGCSGVVGRTPVHGVSAVLSFQSSGIQSCDFGQGQGSFTLQLNTTPPVTLTGRTLFTTSGLTAIFSGEVGSVGVGVPANSLEDCYNVPLTRIRGTFEPITIVTV